MNKCTFVSIVDDVFKRCKNIDDLYCVFLEMQQILAKQYSQNVCFKSYKCKHETKGDINND